MKLSITAKSTIKTKGYNGKKEIKMTKILVRQIGL